MDAGRAIEVNRAWLAPGGAEPVEKVALSDRSVVASMIRRYQPELRRKIAELLEYLAGRKSTAQIEVLLEAGALHKVIDDADLERVGQALAAETGAIYAAAARGVAGVIAASLRIPAAFDPSTERAIRHLDVTGRRILRDLIAEQRQLIQDVIADSMRGGLNPRHTARLFRSTIGLAPIQAQAVASYRRALEHGQYGNALGRKLRDRRFDKTVRAARKAARPLTREQVDQMVSAYASRSLKRRAETIARTETLRAVHNGAQEAWLQAIDGGDIDADEVERRWIATYDNRTRHSHRPMNRQKRKIGIPFRSGFGALLMFPHDPNAPAREAINCRCSVVTRLIPKTADTAAPAGAPAEKPKAPAKPPKVPRPKATPKAPKASPGQLAESNAHRAKHLTEGEVIERRALGGGANTTELVAVEAPGYGVADAVWKPSTGEAEGLRSNIDTGTMWRREAAAFAVAERLGVADLVPVTIAREIDGIAGSLQSFAAAGSRQPATTLSLSDAQRGRVFDIITGNSDRHGGNVLYTGGAAGTKAIPVLIDNGLCFPKGAPSRFIQPEAMALSGKLTKDVRALIDGIDERGLAGDLLDAGIEPIAVRHTLYRTRHLKTSPHSASVIGDLTPTARLRQIREIGFEFMEAEFKIGKAAADEIDALVAELVKERNP